MNQYITKTNIKDHQIKTPETTSQTKQHFNTINNKQPTQNKHKGKQDMTQNKQHTINNKQQTMTGF